MATENFDRVFKSVSGFFSVLSNPDRIKIIGLLLKKEMDVTEIHSELGISQSRISQHLKLMRLKFLVEERREGKHVYYHIKDSRISRVVESALQFQMLGMTTDPETISLLKELFVHWHI